MDLPTPLACVGSLNVDLIAYVPHFPKPGETLMGTHFQQGPGGKGANQAAAAALLSGLPSGCAMVGAVGSDALGADYLRADGAFVRSGVDVARVAVRGAGVCTGVAPIWVDARGENCIVVVPGANATLAAAEVEAALLLGGGGAPFSGVLAQLEVPLEATLAALRGAAAARAPAFFTPAPAPPSLPDEALALASVLIPNQGELFALTGGGAARADEPLEDALCARVALLQARGARSVVVTLGAAGALVVGAPTGAQGGAVARVRAPRVRAVDTSGAGDAFSGSLAFFAAALASARGGGGGSGGGGGGGAAVDVPFDILVDAAHRAVCVATLSVTKKGTQSSYARRADLPPELFDAAQWDDARVATFEAALPAV
jgi:ribokinase